MTRSLDETTYIGKVVGCRDGGATGSFGLFLGCMVLEQLLVDGGVDALVPQAEVLQSIGIVQVRHVVDVHETVDRAQFYQALLAYHLDLFQRRQTCMLIKRWTDLHRRGILRQRLAECLL